MSLETMNLEKIKKEEEINTGDADVEAALDAIDEREELEAKKDVLEGVNFPENSADDNDFFARRDKAVKAIEHINSPEYFENLHKQWEAEALKKREDAVAALAPESDEKMADTAETMELVNEVGQDIEKMVSDVKEYTDYLKARLSEAEAGHSKVAEGLIGIELKKEVENLNSQLDALINKLKAKQEKSGLMLSSKIGIAINEIEAMKM